MFWEKGKKEKGKRIEMIKGREKGFVQVVRKKREKKKELTVKSCIIYK